MGPLHERLGGGTVSGQVEFELTYLASNLPPQLTSGPRRRIVDIYVPGDPRVHPRLRLRHDGDRFELTKKTPVTEGDASAHHESTIQLSAAEFDALASGDRRIEKWRYTARVQDRTVEIDVFTGALTGLVLIDVEFGSRADLERFVPPTFFGPDVTHVDLIAGGLLAGRRYDDIAPALEQLAEGGRHE